MHIEQLLNIVILDTENKQNYIILLMVELVLFSVYLQLSVLIRAQSSD